MEKEYRREQHYAVSNLGILAHIKDAHNCQDDYYCPHCGCRMLKKCGDTRKWHFAHDWRDANELQKNCSYETYLHKYAKLRIKQWFDGADSIILHYKQTIFCKQYDECILEQKESCRQYIEKFYDLKKMFNNCSMESPVKESNGNYRADLLLTSDKDPSRQILIEIKVSHGCSDKKKASGIPIIEFDVSSEDDVDYIISNDIKESNKVRYYGFNLRRTDKTGLIPPARSLYKFFQYKSGKTFCEQTDCQIMKIRKRSSLFELTIDILEVNYLHLTLYGLMKARETGLEFPNCYLCEHYCYKDEIDCYKCEISDEKIEKGSDALKCKSYIFKSNIFEKINYIPIRVLDIWCLHN